MIVAAFPNRGFKIIEGKGAGGHGNVHEDGFNKDYLRSLEVKLKLLSPLRGSLPEKYLFSICNGEEVMTAINSL